MLVDAKWTTNWQPVQASDAKSGFLRQASGFRNSITPYGIPGPLGTAEVGPRQGAIIFISRCLGPWASRTLIARRLNGLDQVVPLALVEP